MGDKPDSGSHEGRVGAYVVTCLIGDLIETVMGDDKVAGPPKPAHTEMMQIVSRQNTTMEERNLINQEAGPPKPAHTETDTEMMQMVGPQKPTVEERDHIIQESMLFKKFSVKSKDLVSKRKSYKVKRNETVVNRRLLKRCPLCDSTNKQMARHIKTVHGLRADASTLVGAARVCKLRTISGGKSKPVCCICKEPRANMRSHLIREHGISPKSTNMKKLISGKKLARATSSIAFIKKAMDKYADLHFNSLDGACFSAKQATAERMKNQKISSVVKMLEFTCTKSGTADIPSLLENVRVLSSWPDGYFNREGASYATIVKEIGYLIEYIKFTRREGLVSPGIVETAIDKLERSQANARRRAKGEHAAFQDKDGRITVLQDDIDKFNNSKRAVTATNMLAAGTPVSQRKAANIRNFVITKLLLDNNCRPSTLENLSTVGFEDAVREPRVSSTGTTYYSVCSTKSKNAESSGKPTYILITEQMASMIQSYIKSARCTLKQPQSSNDLFLLENGDDMTSEHISKAFRSIWIAAGSENPTFKTSANSRHLRHTVSGMSRMLGSDNLKSNAHIGLNHTKEANTNHYLSIVRPVLTVDLIILGFN